MTDLPAWLLDNEPDDPVADVAVDETLLTGDWESRSWRHRAVAEWPAEYANRIRACVRAEIAPPEALSFAEFVETRG